MNLSDWLKGERGRQSDLARYLEIKATHISAWAAKTKPIPVTHMAKIESFTGGDVTRKEMRPDDWHLIWPELANEQKDGVAA
jgi:DNA-binding transcriptional regulator YdaS (Cro superfamily)